MPCMGNQEETCPIGNWCVCQWAFARYIQMAGGCDSIVDIQCDATNLAALNAYKKEQSNDPTIKTALECLESRCSLNTQALYDTDAKTPELNNSSTSSFSRLLVGSALAIFALSIALVVTIRQHRASPRSEDVDRSLFVE